ncbi:hypothetical protein CO726_13880 [Bacillus fungorum]|uniref:Uncharacterized protein n=1 Tax=Bacillus fungorum TaxID=2039284 RepID=A0A2G6QCV9_9BACI|nr:hypothetical protein CO726_13880 [Bacillus fungorum]
MLSPPLLKIQKFNLYFHYMHAFSVLQYFQFLFFPLYTGFLLLSIPLNSTPNKCIFAYSIKILLFTSLLL